MNIFEERINAALAIIERCGSIDGAHHKQWVIDQVVRKLKAHHYEKWVEEYEEADENGEKQYEWDTGIAP